VGFFDFDLSGTKARNNNPPNKAPYKVDLKGLDQIAQVPSIQPTNFQYKKPPRAPVIVPMLPKKMDLLLLWKNAFNIVSSYSMQK